MPKIFHIKFTPEDEMQPEEHRYYSSLKALILDVPTGWIQSADTMYRYDFDNKDYMKSVVDENRQHIGLSIIRKRACLSAGDVRKKKGIVPKVKGKRKSKPKERPYFDSDWNMDIPVG